MSLHEGLTHLDEYDQCYSNVDMVNLSIDHKIKAQSAATDPSWNNGVIGVELELFLWCIVDFEIVPWPWVRHGSLHTGDSYIVLKSGSIDADGHEYKRIHDVHF